MKLTCTTLCLVLCALAVAQQPISSDNVTVGVLPTTASDAAAKKYCTQVYAAISNVFTTKKRFTVVDRTKLDQIAQERNLQKQEDFLDGFVVEQGKSLGAQFLIQANISQIIAQYVQIQKFRVVSVNPYKSEKYFVDGYNVTALVNVQTIDVSTGQVKGSKTIDLSQQWETNNPEVAIASSLKRLEARGYTPLEQWVNDMFPVDMKVIKVEEADKKGRPKKVLIKGGSDMDLNRGKYSGSKLQVYINEVLSIDGKEYTRPAPVGEVMIDELQGDFAVCKVTEGADEILKRLNEGKILFLKMIKW